MTESQASEILAAHNAWRRHNSADELPLLPMQDPLDVGRAIDVAVRALAECEQLRTALDDLGVTPEEARAGVKRSKANKLDAARYRYLRSHPERVSVAVVVQGHWLPAIGEQLDAAIAKATEETK